MYEHKTLLIDSQFRQKTDIKEMPDIRPDGIPWNFYAVSDALDSMSAAGWEHYQSLELTNSRVCDNYSGHGVLLFFRRKRE